MPFFPRAGVSSECPRAKKWQATLVGLGAQSRPAVGAGLFPAADGFPLAIGAKAGRMEVAAGPGRGGFFSRGFGSFPPPQALARAALRCSPVKWWIGPKTAPPMKSAAGRVRIAAGYK